MKLYIVNNVSCNPLNFTLLKQNDKSELPDNVKS
jgi:hypothetical protein